ncbi:hypothetical protein [Mycolicibacterium sp. NCC-Tsukiji]|uniref:hypothetical protein n=1 Tax=Mycolicibacterium sp. NCC-Tsukiji TaxID=2185272 RepID=UPI001FCE811B|nr:hypothetical protein [Mycolicibacterium sp. NCC-Tsukiji]
MRAAIARALAISAAMSAALTMAATSASASPAHRMLLLANLHTCDFQLVTTQLGRASAKPFAEITSDGRIAVAHIDLTNGADDAQYAVRVIPAPHAVLGCRSGDRGITTGTLVTDAFGSGSITLQAPIPAGTSGMWLAVDLPSAHSQIPDEFYSSNYIAPV